MFDVVIIGAGPAGIGVLSCLCRMQVENPTIAVKICVIDAATPGDFGSLSQYQIGSDTQAVKFLTCLDGLPKQILLDAKLMALHNEIRLFGTGPAPLPLVGAFFQLLGGLLRHFMKNIGMLECKFDCKATRATWMDGHWHVNTISPHGGLDIMAKHIVMASGAKEGQSEGQSGGHESGSRLSQFLSAYDLQRSELKSIHMSSEILTAKSNSPIFDRLRATKSPRIAIIGGSHSAISVAATLMDSNIKFDAAGITIFHRSPMRATFDSVEHAHGHGFTDFTNADICPHSKRVYALKGFRLKSRDLLLAIQGYDGGAGELRIALTALHSVDKARVKAALLRADLVVSALGYCPDYIPLFRRGRDGEIGFNGPDYVNQCSQVLDPKQNIILNCYAVGLAANYKLTGQYGEPSFTGQANGLVLWHKDIGMQIARAVVGAGAMVEKPFKARA